MYLYTSALRYSTSTSSEKASITSMISSGVFPSLETHLSNHCSAHRRMFLMVGDLV